MLKKQLSLFDLDMDLKATDKLPDDSYNNISETYDSLINFMFK